MKRADRFRLPMLLAAGLILCGVYSWRESGRTFGGGSSPDGKPVPASLRERSEPSTTYTLRDGAERLRLAMDRFVARGADGSDEIVPLHPPATAATLAKRIAEHTAPRGVFPIAYAEDDDHDPLRIITSEIRARVPRIDAARVARAHGVRIVATPDYAPEWVIFAASDPFAAMQKIESLRDDPQVDSADILIGRRPILMALPNDPLIASQWHLKASGTALAGSDMNVEGAWNYGGSGGVRGRGVKIAIIDSGIDNAHTDFVGNIDTILDKDFVTGDDNSDSPASSSENHGTAVAGVAAARGNNGYGVSGVAPEATLVGARLVTGGFITDAQTADAISHHTDVIQIKNNSWGYGSSIYQAEPLLAAAIRSSAQSGRGGKGTIITFAAGNDGASGANSNYSELTSSMYVIAVGATDSLNQRAYFSEPGANVLISAPSYGPQGGTLGITTTDRTGSAGYNTTGDTTSSFSGTSASCPAVSGVIALMLEKNPNLGWRDVQEILIRTARKINPTATGWTTNAAGLHFNHDFGAGLVDATAAVALASTWTNLGTQVSVSGSTNISLAIPNNSASGVEIPFPLPASNIRTERVTVKLSINHDARGDLEISLISPSGTESRLAEVRSDNLNNYSGYTFSSVRNWGENSSGTWRLKIADRKNSPNTTGGTVTAAELTVHGTPTLPVNIAPTAGITSPADGALFSPGVGFNVRVDATDLGGSGVAGQVSRVDLYENGQLVATSTQSPYVFPRNPPTGLRIYTAKATDGGGLVGESQQVAVIIQNQTPSILSATLSSNGQSYDDVPLSVVSVNATDPENAPLTLGYRWQFSVDGENYIDTSSTTPALPPNPGNSSKLWRCLITASDGNTTSEPLLAGPVNLLDRPPVTPTPRGGSYSYQSGLVLVGHTIEINRQALIHEFSQGPVGGSSEWIEILTLQQGSLSGWILVDESGNSLRFKPSVWDDIPAGTLIVIRNGTQPKDPLLPADDANPTDGTMALSSTDTTRFDTSSVWPSLNNLGDSIYLKNSFGFVVHEISYGDSNLALPNVGSVSSGEAAYYAGRSDAGASLADQWLRTTATTTGVTPGLPNNPDNANFVDRIRTGSLYEPSKFFIAASNPLPGGLTLDSETGLISGTISPTVPPGTYTVSIEIRNGVGGVSSQSIAIEISNAVVRSYQQWISQYSAIDQSVTGNTDLDDLPNLVEYAMNSRPDLYELPSPVTIGQTANTIFITYTKSTDINDVSLVAEWSPTMEPSSWLTAGIVDEVLENGINTRTIRSSVTIDPAYPARFIRLKAIATPPP